MNVNYLVKCRICGSITRIRIPIGHLEEYPISIYCGQCESILRGRFLMNQEEVTYHVEFDNCDQVIDGDTNFFSEISGDLICNKVEECSNKDLYYFSSRLPFIKSASNMGFDSMQEYINKLTKINVQIKEWEDNRTIFDLYLGRKYQYLPNVIVNKLPKEEYSLSNDLEILRGVHYIFLNTIENIFETDDFVSALKLINSEMTYIDNEKIKDFIDYLDSSDIDLVLYYEKTIEIFCNFMKIFRCLLPALSAKRYCEGTIDYNEQGITTCTFDDIKMFYIDTYESLLSMAIIPICLDNIKIRNEYTIFKQINEDNIKLEKFLKMNKGTRLNLLKQGDTFSNLLNLKFNNKLRNAIGHNNYDFNGITQVIEYSPDPKNLEKKEKNYLLEVAIECIDLMQAAMVMSDIIFHLVRKKNMFNGIYTCVNSYFYKHVSVNDKCPCGSGKKYKKCCKIIIEKVVR